MDAGLAYCVACGEALPRPVTTLERKVVSVLFVDVIEFTQRAERLDPEQVRELVAPFYERARAELERFGGTVEKFIGDAVMALFGAPLAHEDDPERAVRAAWAVREALERLNEEHGIDLHVRMGITTGEVVVSLGARPQEGEAMAHGDVVNTAARLQAGAPVDGILVDEATYRATVARIELREAPPLRVKGKAEPVPVWEVIGPRARTGVDPLRRQTSLVGRARELDALAAALDQARTSSMPRLVTLVGEPGIGKSRLVWELSRRVADEPGIVWWRQGRCLPYGDGVTFWALGEMVKAQAGILETDTAERAGDKLSLAVADAVNDSAEAPWVERHLRPLVGLAIEELRGDRRVEAFAAWRRFLGGLAARRPLVLVFEDIHWADDDLLDFVGHELARLTGPVLMLATSRPELLERRPEWASTDGLEVITVSPLPEPDTARLVTAVLDQALLPAELQALVLARSGGNPLYAEEYLRMLQDRGLLRRSGRGWVLEAPDELPLPESVQGIIAARLDALPLEEKALLQDAAVVGRGFWLGSLTAIARAPRWSVEHRLDQLERRELIRRDRPSAVASEPQYTFLHALVRDVAYAQIPRAARAEKHRLAADWIESLAPDRSEDRAEMLAHHYLSAIEADRAAGRQTEAETRRAGLALRDAGDRALALNAFAAAVRHYRVARDLWSRGDGGYAELLARLGKARFHAEGAGAEELVEAREGLLAAGELEQAAEAIGLLGELDWMAGETAAAFSRFEESVALLSEAPPSRAKANAVSTLSRFLMLAGSRQEAIRVGLEALRMAEELGLDELRAHALDNIGVARAGIGDRGGIADLERSIEIAVALGSPEAIRGYVNLGTTVAEIGNLQRAFDLYAEGRAAAERLGDADRIRWFESERLYELYWRGRWDEAADLADRLIAETDAAAQTTVTDYRLVRGRIRLARGDPGGAREDARWVLDLSRGASYPQELYPALAFAARAQLACGDVQEAGRLAQEQLRLWSASGGETPASFWSADLAWVVRALGRESDLLTAAESVRAPTRWLDAARAVAEGKLAAAADVYAEIGSKPDEAVARLALAEELAAVGNPGAEAQRERALAFLHAAGADAHLVAPQRDSVRSG